MSAIAAKLIQAGRSASTPVLVVENGFGTEERILTCTLDDVAEVLATERVGPPAVFVIGDVVRRREVVAEWGLVRWEASVILRTPRLSPTSQDPSGRPAYPRRHVIVVRHAGERQTFSVHEVAASR